MVNNEGSAPGSRELLRHELWCSMDGKTRRTSVQHDAGLGGDVLENLGQQAARISDGRKLSGLFQLAQGPVHGHGPEALDALRPAGPVVAARPAAEPWGITDCCSTRDG